MAGIGHAMRERAVALAALDQAVVDGLGDQGGRDRHVGARERLGHGHDVGFDAVGVAAEHLAGPPETGDDLVGHHQDVVLLEHCLDLCEVAGRRNDHPARTLHRLGEEGSDGVGALAGDDGFEVGDQPIDHLFVGLARMGRVIEAWAAGAQHACDRQVEVGMVVGQAGEACRHDGDAVIAALACNQLFLLGFAKRIEVVPDHLDRGIVRLGAGVGKQRLVHAEMTGHGEQTFGQLDRRLVRAAGKDLVVGQLLHLPDGSVDQTLLGKAECGAPQAGHAFEKAVALVVFDIDAIALADHHRAGCAEGVQRGVGMDQVAQVFADVFGMGAGHDGLRWEKDGSGIDLDAGAIDEVAIDGIVRLNLFRECSRPFVVGILTEFQQ